MDLAGSECSLFASFGGIYRWKGCFGSRPEDSLIRLELSSLLPSDYGMLTSSGICLLEQAPRATSGLSCGTPDNLPRLASLLYFPCCPGTPRGIFNVSCSCSNGAVRARDEPLVADFGVSSVERCAALALPAMLLSFCYPPSRFVPLPFIVVLVRVLQLP